MSGKGNGTWHHPFPIEQAPRCACTKLSAKNQATFSPCTGLLRKKRPVDTLHGRFRKKTNGSCKRKIWSDDRGDGVSRRKSRLRKFRRLLPAGNAVC